MIETMETNDIYFKQVVRDAVKDLRKNGEAFVFSREQLDEVIKNMNKEVNFEYDGYCYNLSINR